MKRLMIIVGILVALVMSCKQNPDTEKPKVEPPEKETKAEKQLSPLIAELAEFAISTSSGVTAIDQLFLYMEINENGVLQEVDVDKAVGLYNQITKSKKSKSWPIFEIKDTDTAILFARGVGFGGPIWAKVLVDKKTLKIKKIEFEHKAESDGYGAAITQSSFEDKFVGTKIDLEKNTFILQKNIEKRMDDGTVVDGISGATMTSEAAVEMVNYGLQKYAKYLGQQ